MLAVKTGSMNRTPKIKDVARLAGVSTATVSRTLNDVDRVSAETKDSVLRAAKEVGYRINHSARSLRLQQTGAVAVLIPNVGNPFFSNILAGIESVMTKSRINVLILDTQSTTSHQSYTTDYLTSQRADGIICLDGQLRPDAEAGPGNMMNLPVVFACEWPDSADCNVVRSDNAHGATLAVNHLVSLGHRNIGHLEGPNENVLTTVRRKATIDALKTSKLPVIDEWFFSGDFGLESGVLAAKQWLALENRPTALFCASDLMAIGVMAELSRNGVSVPGELSVMGFDDIDIARYYSPALTTIHQRTRVLGETAAEVLLDRLHGRECEENINIVDVELVCRASTARWGNSDVVESLHTQTNGISVFS